MSVDAAEYVTGKSIVDVSGILGSVQTRLAGLNRTNISHVSSCKAFFNFYSTIPTTIDLFVAECEEGTTTTEYDGTMTHDDLADIIQNVVDANFDNESKLLKHLLLKPNGNGDGSTNGWAANTMVDLTKVVNRWLATGMDFAGWDLTSKLNLILIAFFPTHTQTLQYYWSVLTQYSQSEQSPHLKAVIA